MACLNIFFTQGSFIPPPVKKWTKAEPRLGGTPPFAADLPQFGYPAGFARLSTKWLSSSQHMMKMPEVHEHYFSSAVHAVGFPASCVAEHHRTEFPLLTFPPSLARSVSYCDFDRNNGF